jgi:ABC-type nitrate/sulfonate/bicarbonate transport system permease component
MGFGKNLRQICSASQHIPCDFASYANATDLTDDQKLLPNTDITGRKVVIAFIITSFLSIALGVCLIFDEWHIIHTQRRQNENSRRQ